jgi:fructokinase
VILVCGECIIDLAPSDTGAGLWRAMPGGSPANTAVALARLGVPAAMAARLSGDAFGRRLRQHLVDNGVDLRFAVDVDEPATLAVVSTDDRHRAGYTFYRSGTADWGWLPGQLSAGPWDGITAVHAGSMALMIEPGCHEIEALLSAAHERQLVVSVDPNVRPDVCTDRATYVAAVLRWAAVADIVKLSDDDLRWLAPQREPVDVAAQLAAAGPALVVLTQGEHGASAVRPTGETVSVAGVAVDVLDTVGAGDAFSAGLLRALDNQGLLTPTGVRALTAREVSEALRFAVHVAALTCTRRGADPPRLTPDQQAVLAARATDQPS